jgi:hypothetical protein
MQASFQVDVFPKQRNGPAGPYSPDFIGEKGTDDSVLDILAQRP